MCDVERWHLWSTSVGVDKTLNNSVSSCLSSASWDTGSASVIVGGVETNATLLLTNQQDNSIIQGWSQFIQCSLSEEYLPITLTLLLIVKWICISVFCQFYRFLARFSGRRRCKTSSPMHLRPHLHSYPQVHHSQHVDHAEHQQQRHLVDASSSSSSSAQDLLRVSSSSPPHPCRSNKTTLLSPSRRSFSPLSAYYPWSEHRMRKCSNYTLATLILVATTLLGAADACSSRSTPKPRSPSPTARPNVTFHTFACPPAYATWYCLNGATCFTVKIGESLLYNCECADGYMGQRCEFKDLDGSYLPSRQKVMLEKASIAGGASIATVLVVVVFIALYIHRHRRRKEMIASATDGSLHRDLERRPFGRFTTPHVHMDGVVVSHAAFSLHPIPNPSRSIEAMSAGGNLVGVSISPHALSSPPKLMPPPPPPRALHRAAEP